MENETEQTNRAQGAAPKTKEVEVQYSIKWVNFAITVEATDVENALELAYQAYKERGTDAFSIRANNEDVSTLADIFDSCPVAPRVTDENGNLNEWCFRFDDEDEDEDQE